MFWLMATPGVVGTADAIAGWDMVAWYLVWAALLWVVVAIVALTGRRTGGQAQPRAPRGQLEGREAVPTRAPSTQGASRG
jgi:threonine/homoserine/homoserine lactone efflux protein